MKAFSVLLLLAATWSSHPGLQQVEKAIGDRGAQAVADELNHQKSGAGWESIENRVATGNNRWLQVAKELRTYTDAGVSEGLDNSMAEALPKNANGVLAVLSEDRSKTFTVPRICSVETFIEVPRATLRRHLRASIAAVQSVSNPDLQTVRQACLTTLKRDLK